MRRKKRSWKLLISAILGIGALVYMLLYVPPDTAVSLGKFNLSVIFLFFPLLFLIIFSVIDFAFKSSLHGTLAGLLICTYLLFRLNHLTHPFFLVILIALFLTLELLFARPRH